MQSPVARLLDLGPGNPQEFLCRLLIPEAVERLFQARDEAQLFLTLGHVAPFHCRCVQF